MRRRAGRRAWRSDGGALRRRAERSTGSASHRELSSAQTARARTCFTRLAVRSLPAGWSEPASRRAGNQSACNALNCWSSAECMYCAGAKVAKVRPGHVTSRADRTGAQKQRGSATSPYAGAWAACGAQWNFFCGLCCALLSGYRYATPPGGADARVGANALATTAFTVGETGPSRAPRLLQRHLPPH